MKRAVTYIGVWLTATTAAVTLSWLGVRDVIRGAVFDQPGSVPVVHPVAVQPPATSSNPAPVPPPPDTVDSAMPQSPPRPDPKPNPSPAEDADDVRTYEVKGGTVVLSVRPDGAELVSATPRPGYTVQTWDHHEGWLRVEFTAGQRASAVIATWHDHPTTVETQEH
jgi:hypothetical protein